MRRIMFAFGASWLALAGCDSKKAHDEYKEKGKVSEAELNLKAIEKGLKAHYHEQAMFPSGTAAQTPTKACCEGPNHKCPVNTGDWLSNPVWSAIDFELTEPSYFQYSYDSKDGQTAVAKAVGDLDCDATTVTYEVRCEAKEGNPSCELTKPDKAD